MNDERFMELVNLCIDGELGDAEAREFEAALDASAARRAVYEQYRLMDQGCKVLVSRAQRQAPSSAVFRRTMDSLEWKMANPGRSRWREPFALAWASAAAAVCLMFALATMKEHAGTRDASSIVASAQDELHQQTHGVVSFEDVAKVLARNEVKWENQGFSPGVAAIQANTGNASNEDALSLEAAQLKKLAIAALARARVFNGTDSEEMSAFELKH